MSLQFFQKVVESDWLNIDDEFLLFSKQSYSCELLQEERQLSPEAPVAECCFRKFRQPVAELQAVSETRSFDYLLTSYWHSGSKKGSWLKSAAILCSLRVVCRAC